MKIKFNQNVKLMMPNDGMCRVCLQPQSKRFLENSSQLAGNFDLSFTMKTNTQCSIVYLKGINFLRLVH